MHHILRQGKPKLGTYSIKVHEPLQRCNRCRQRSSRLNLVSRRDQLTRKCSGYGWLSVVSVNTARSFRYTLNLATPTACTLASLAPGNGSPSPWLALAAFIGLPLALWAYKCLMLVIFQRKIIYMGYIPPGARSQELQRDIPVPSGLLCEDIQIRGERNAKLHALLVRRNVAVQPQLQLRVVVVYFQGNAGNPLSRMSVFERLLLGTSLTPTSSRAQSILDSIAILSIAPRSYWKSSNRRPTERGITSDYLHAIRYASRRFPDTPIILYGHSLGGAAAVCLSSQVRHEEFPNVKGLILENPFASIPWMVKALYPQKWLPYHYLGRFAFDKWDALEAMRNVRKESLLDKLREEMLVILSQKDEIVPNEMGMALLHAGRTTSSGKTDTASSSRSVVIAGALHDNAWTIRQWRQEFELYVQSVVLRSHE